MRQVEQRVSVRCNLGPLSLDGVAGYVAHRLQWAGGSPDRVRFSADALEFVYRLSGGVPRLINRVCDRALYQGYLKRAAIVDRQILEASIPDVEPAAAEIPGTASALPPVWLPTSERVDKTSERIDKWLTLVDDETRAAGGLVLAAHPSDPSTQAAGPGEPRADQATLVPRTYIERLTSRWLRRVLVAAFWVMGLGVAVVAAPHVGILLHLGALLAEFGETPASPALPPKPLSPMPPALKVPAAPETLPAEFPAARSYIIEVALFNSQERAGRLVEDLTAAGYQAYEAAVNLGDAGIRRQVLLGPYATRAEAASDLERVRQMPAYQDARVVERSRL